MTDYSELLNRLRKHEWVPIIKEAAAALEAQAKEIEELQKSLDEGTALWAHKQMAQSERIIDGLRARITYLEAERAKVLGANFRLCRQISTLQRKIGRVYDALDARAALGEK